ncbi:MAG: recombinase RecT [Campylobacterales bacterium]|nr:recombinase RecT [Campylobacterales bacterium]
MAQDLTTLSFTGEVTKFFKSVENIEYVKKQFFPASATEKDIIFCFETAARYQLDPVLKQIFFIERRSKNPDTQQWETKVEPLVGKDGFLTIAHMLCDQTAGKPVRKTFSLIDLSTRIAEAPVLQKDEWVMKKDLVAEVFLVVKSIEGANVVETEWKHKVNYNEYVQKTKDGVPTKFWSEKPDTMLKKVALSQVLKMAFNVNGLYSAEEFGGTYTQDGNIVIDVEPTAVLQYSFTQLENSAKGLGLTLSYDNGRAYVTGGNPFDCSKSLLEIGFKVENKKWFCVCVDDRKTVDATTAQTEVKQEEEGNDKQTTTKTVEVDLISMFPNEKMEELKKLELSVDAKESDGKVYYLVVGTIADSMHEKLVKLGFQDKGKKGWLLAIQKEPTQPSLIV